MKLTTLFVGVILLVMGQTEGLLPPLYHTLNEYKTLLDDPQLVEKLQSGQSIQMIKRTDSGFDILTPKYVLHVDVVYEETRVIGPAKFHLVFHDPVPRIQK